jgi:hypothetical protein
MGYESDLFDFDARGDFRIKHGVGGLALKPPVRSLLIQLGKIGKMHNTVRAYVDDMLSRDVDRSGTGRSYVHVGDNRKTPVRCALAAGLSRHLQQFYDHCSLADLRPSLNNVSSVESSEHRLCMLWDSWSWSFL